MLFRDVAAWLPAGGPGFCRPSIDVRDPSSPSFGHGREKGSKAVLSPWPSYGRATAGRCLCGCWPPGGVPAPGLPVVRRAAGLLVGLPAACPGGGRCRRIFVPRLRCGHCRVTHALLPAFVLAAGQGGDRRRGDRGGGRRRGRGPAAAAGHPVTQTLTPPPPSFETSKTSREWVHLWGTRTRPTGRTTRESSAAAARAPSIFRPGRPVT